MKHRSKIVVSALLCLCLLLGTGSTAFAASAVSSQTALDTMEKNIPVVRVNGFGATIYKGLSTETPEDDVQLWGPQSEVIAEVVALYGPQLAVWLATEDYDRAAAVLSDALQPLFLELACDENGVPNPDTGIKDENRVEPKESYGYENCYAFEYDWRLDMHTLAAQLGEFIARVKQVTGSDRVALTAMSMGNCVLTTYLYEQTYNNPSYDPAHSDIASQVYLAGAMNGVASCGDPFSGEIELDSTSLMRFLSQVMIGNTVLQVVYTALESIYAAGVLEPVFQYANRLTDALLKQVATDGMTTTLATMPGFYALMGPQEYLKAREFIFDSPEKEAQFSGLLAKNDYYHNSVQANNVSVINALRADGVKTAVICEYGYTMAPVTSDNDRMSDTTITTECESFGATCAEVDGTLGEGYVQANACCGENHISPDNQIDASTGAFPDITWYAKYMKHSMSEQLLGELINLIIYSDAEIDVFTYTEYPQFLASTGEKLIPMNPEYTEQPVPFEQTTLVSRITRFIQWLILCIRSLTARTK